MKRQVRLYIGGQEADLNDDNLILFNYTHEDLTNPTIVKNSYTQQVTLKGTPTNNDIFGHIWRLDRVQQYGGGIGPEFDPSRKTGFQLFDGTGNLLESGYVKLDTILRHGADIQYGITLYGGLGSFLYGLAFDGDGNQRSLASLDFLSTDDPDHELDFTINAQAVTDAWARLLTNPATITDVWDVINFAPCYNGLPDRFEPSKGLVKPADIGMPATHPEDSTYGTLNGWALLNMTKGMTEWEAKDLRSYLQRPVVSVNAVLAAIAKQSNNGGFTFDASVLQGSDYDGMWLTLPLLPSLDSYKNVQETITLAVDSTPGSGNFSVPVSIGTSLQVGSKVDVSMNIAFAATVSGATATPLHFDRATYTSGIGTTERYDFSGFFAQLVAYDAQDRILAGSKVICVGSANDYGHFSKDGKARADACEYTPEVETEYTFVEAVLAGASGSYVLSTDLNLTVSCYDAAKYKIFISPYHYRKTIHFGELYRKTWRSHALGSGAMKAYFSGSEYTYSAMTLSSGTAGSTASYKTPESVRSGAAVTKAMLLSTDYTPADFLLGIVKSLGLYLHFDGAAKKVTLMSRNTYFKPTIIDIDSRIDRGRQMQITPIAFDTKWLEMSSESIGSAYEDYYKETYGQDYGIQKIGTSYDFNSDSAKIMESVVFRSGVQVCESSRYFNDVSGTPGDVPSQMLDSGNTLTYRNTAGDTSDTDVPVISSPTIAYWGSQSFADVEGYDWLTACKLQVHDADGKALDGSGVLLFRSGVQIYDHFKISDDLPEMITLTDGSPCWLLEDGTGAAVPVFTRCKTSPIYKMISALEFEYRGEGITTALDFGRVQELACPHMAYFPGQDNVTVYEKMWRAYLRDRYNVNTRVVTAWVNMTGIQVTGESLRQFYFFDNALWSLNRVINYSVTTDDPVQCEFVKVQDQADYLYGQNFGGQQARGTLDITVTPDTATVTVDGSAIILSSGHASVSLTAGQHLIQASASGYSTASQVVTIRPEETTTVSLSLTAGVEQLYINVDPATASPVITLTVDGVSTPYTAGMNISDGAVVVITVSASGYATQTRTITMSPANATQYFSLTQDIEATVSYNGDISSAAQRIYFTISDPSRHGWSFNWSGLDTYGYLTEYGKTSGTTSVLNGDGAIGVGDAVLYIGVTANTSADDRSFSRGTNFEDGTTGTRTNITINQQGTGSTNVPVTSVTLNKASLSLLVNGAETLVATVLPSNATNKTLSWTSTNSSVATVSQSGRVTGLSAGTAVIRAYATDGSNKYAECTVTVTTQTVPVTGVTLDKASIQVSVGGAVTLTPSIAPGNATNKNVTWTSADPTIATVSDGVVTGVAVGLTAVTVRTVDGGYTAVCVVEVVAHGSMSASDIVVKSVAESASAALDAQYMQKSTIQASVPSSATWIRSVTVDPSGDPVYIRFVLSRNTSTTNSRSATVTVTGYDEGGELITTTFTITQNKYSSSDVPCTAMTIGGSDTIANSNNESTYTVGYTPGATTQAGCLWSVQNAGGLVELVSSGNSCTVKVKEGANDLPITLVAQNSYNLSLSTTKVITVSYVAPSPVLSVNPASVRVNATQISDQTPVVTTNDIQSGSLIVKSVSGFITSASIQNGRIVTSFTENSDTSERMGSVTLQALDSEGTAVTAVVEYVQGAGGGSGSTSFWPVALNVQQSGGNVVTKFKVAYQNDTAYTTTFAAMFWTLVAYDSNNGTLFVKSGTLSSRDVAALTTEIPLFTESWKGTLGEATHYALTVSDYYDTATYNGNGDDNI